MSAGESTQQELFGGAMVASIPKLFIDASDIRPVPSEQEVFVSATPATDTSIVIDILERVDPEKTELGVDAEEAEGANGGGDGGGVAVNQRSNSKQLQDLEACRVHFEDILDGREGSIGRLFHAGPLTGVETKLGPAIPTYTIKGTVSSPDSPAPPRDGPDYASAQQALPYSLLLIIVFRLEQVETDLLVTINCPVTLQQDIMLEQRVWHPAYDAPPGGEKVPPSESQVVNDAITLAGKVVASLEIRDWGLFLPN